MATTDWIRISNYKNRSIPGGWHVFVTINGMDYTVNSISPADSFAKLRKLYKSLGVEVSDDQIKDYLNDYWCSKAPDRCTGTPSQSRNSAIVSSTRVDGTGCTSCGQKKRVTVTSIDHSKVGINMRRILTPDFWGPIIWRQLNLFGVYFDKELFNKYMDWIHGWLDPENTLNHGSGCIHCFQEFKNYILANPYDKISNAKDCALWVNKFHNSVNARVGRKAMTIEGMRVEYGVAL